MKNQKTRRVGTSVADTLLIVFVVLKLCNVVQWSWVWVLAPAWIPFAIIIFVCILIKILK